jgi:transcriptional regulator with XRE-family HTH domain
MMLATRRALQARSLQSMPSTSIMNEFVTWLNFETEKQGWSLQQMARRVGVCRMDIMRIARGQAKPSADFCWRVALVLNVPPVEVFRRAGFLPPESEDIPVFQEVTHSGAASL